MQWLLCVAAPLVASRPVGALPAGNNDPYRDNIDHGWAPDNNGVAPEASWYKYPVKEPVQQAKLMYDELSLFPPKFTTHGAHDVTVSWQPPPNVDSKQWEGLTYELQGLPSDSAANGGEWQTLHKGPETTFDVKGMWPQSEYGFRVVAVSPQHKGGASDPAYMQSLHEPYVLPSEYGMKVLDVTYDKVTLEWKGLKNATNDTIYEIEYQPQQVEARQEDGFAMPKDPWKIGNSVRGFTTTATIQFLKPTTTYQFRVKCKDQPDWFESRSTSTVTKKAPPPPPPIVPKPPITIPVALPQPLTLPAPLVPLQQFPGTINVNPQTQTVTNWAKTPSKWGFQAAHN